MHTLFKTVAWGVGNAISCVPGARDLFRASDFKGKQLISDFVQLPAGRGEYRCNGVRFDLDFSDAIQRAIYLGTYERHELRFLKHYVKRGWICVDVGANVGFYTMNLAKLIGPTGRVEAVEASPANFERLSRNICLNAFTNCHATQAAITDADAPIHFYTSPKVNSGWGRVDKFDGATDTIEVDGKTFDSFASDRELTRVDFLKIDIEGHELRFLSGARRSLQSGVIKRALVEFCGYTLEPQGIFLAEYVSAFEAVDLYPVHLSVKQIAEAKKGTYTPRRQILNLLFEHPSVAIGERRR